MSASPEKDLADESVLHDHQQWHWMIHVKKFGHRNVLLAMDSVLPFLQLGVFL